MKLLHFVDKKAIAPQNNTMGQCLYRNIFHISHGVYDIPSIRLQNVRQRLATGWQLFPRLTVHRVQLRILYPRFQRVDR